MASIVTVADMASWQPAVFKVRIMYMLRCGFQSGSQPLLLVTPPALTLTVTLSWAVSGTATNKAARAAAGMNGYSVGSELSLWQTVLAVRPSGLPYDARQAMTNGEPSTTLSICCSTYGHTRSNTEKQIHAMQLMFKVSSRQTALKYTLCV